MKTLLLILTFFNGLLLAQPNKNLSQFKADQDKVYLFLRGTVSKRNLVAKEFNITTSPATHIGLGLVTNGKLEIYNVSSDKVVNGSSLIVDSIQSYYDSNSDLFYASVYSRSINRKSKIILLSTIDKIRRRKIVFDKQFSLTNNDTLYCSEFVVNVLDIALGREKIPTQKMLSNAFLKAYFRRNYLIYYPVDFLNHSKNYHLIFEEYF